MGPYMDPPNRFPRRGVIRAALGRYASSWRYRLCVDSYADAADDRWQPFRDGMPLSQWVETLRLREVEAARRMRRNAGLPLADLFGDYWRNQP